MYFNNFQECIRGRGLRKIPVDPLRTKGERAEAEKDLESAKTSFQESDYKWATIQAYYSMFHSFKSLLLSEGYHEKSHECVIIGVEELFTNRGKLSPDLVKNIRSAKNAREIADYRGTYGEATARGIIHDAEEILSAAVGYLDKRFP